MQFPPDLLKIECSEKSRWIGSHNIDNQNPKPMPYCPKCGSEFRPEIDVCAECLVDLVAEPPPVPSGESAEVDWVELYTFPGSLYSRMAIELLNREGIAAYSQSDISTSSLGVGSGDYFGATSTVFVPEPDFDRGRDVIETMIDEIPGGPESGMGDDEENNEY